MSGLNLGKAYLHVTLPLNRLDLDKECLAEVWVKVDYEVDIL